MENANSMAVKSLVFGVVSISLFVLSIVLAFLFGLMWYLPVSGAAFGIIGLVFSSRAMGKAKAANVQIWEGKGLNIGGLVCSIVGTTMSAVFAVVIVVLFFNAQQAEQAKVNGTKIQMHNIEEAKVDGTKIQMHNIEEALDAYQIRTVSYPSTEEGLQILVTQGVIKELPRDMWGNEFQYVRNNARSYKIRSFGADGTAGGAGFDKDLVLRK